MLTPAHCRQGRGALLAAAGAPSTVEAARLYAGLGWSPIPLRGKVPAVTWKAYQSRRPLPGEISGWARRCLFGNVGLVCGPVSGGLVVLDLDGERAYIAFAACFPGLARTYTVATGSGHGRHVYLVAEHLPPSTRAVGTPIGNLELRAAGHQVAAPPSRHPVTGRLYRVICPLRVQVVPDLERLAGWIASFKPHPCLPAAPRSLPFTFTTLRETLAGYFRNRGYRQHGDWLNGPCIHPERHQNHDRHFSFGFNTRSAYGYCHVCGSMLARDMAAVIGINP